MASVHQFNEALAKVRGMPLGTVEAHSRVLRREGVLPATKRGGAAEPLTPTQAGYMLATIMRGSPGNAAENAREIGDLVLYSIDGSALNAMVDRVQQALGWSESITFAEAVGWLIDRYVDETINRFVSGDGIEVKIDRYWTMAWLRWQPCDHVLDAYMRGWREAFKIDPPEDAFGGQRWLEIGFHTPLLHEAKVSYGKDKARNREAHRKFNEMKERASQLDLWGTEKVTHRTLKTIAEVFK